jgi:F-type H+-transporting ATPase subunit gamma
MAQTISAIRNQIQSVKQIQSVVTTMKALAAVNIRQYEDAVKAINQYNHTVETGLEVALRHRPEEIKIAERVLSGPLGAIIFGSDQGMVGQFNQDIVNHSSKMLDSGSLAGRECTHLAVGYRISRRLAMHGQIVEKQLRTPSTLSGITPLVQELLVHIQTWREDLQIEQIFLFFNSPLHGTAYRTKALQLLPIDLRWIQELEAREWPSRGLPTYLLDWDKLFTALIREIFFVTLYRACAESLSSENISRLSSMQAAESNIEDRLANLQNRYQNLRQTSITEELLDIVAGFEALSGEVE